MRFRPRPFLRRPGPGRRPPLNPRLAQLYQANQLAEEGRPHEAAPLYAQLAQAAQTHQMPRRAVNLYRRAGECYSQAGQPAAALSEARAALDMLLAIGQRQPAAHFLRHFTTMLDQRGYATEADTLRREYQSRLPLAEGVERPAPTTTARGRLPAACPHCAAPLRSDEVEWIDAHSVECAYCGNVIPTE